MDDFDMQWLIDLIAHFEVLHPGGEITTISDLSARLEQRLDRGEVDVAVVKRLLDGAVGSEGSAGHFEKLCWVQGIGFNWNRNTPLPIVAFHEGCVYRKHSIDKLRLLNIPFRIAYEGYSYANVRAAVAAGLGIAVLPQQQIGIEHVLYERTHSSVPLPDLGCVELVVRTSACEEDSIISAFRCEVEQRIMRARVDPLLIAEATRSTPPEPNRLLKYPRPPTTLRPTN